MTYFEKLGYIRGYEAALNDLNSFRNENTEGTTKLMFSAASQRLHMKLQEVKDSL
jgi:hypothetical protein